MGLASEADLEGYHDRDGDQEEGQGLDGSLQELSDPNEDDKKKDKKAFHGQSLSVMNRIRRRL